MSNYSLPYIHSLPALQKSGTARPSYTSSLLDELNPEAGSEEESIIRDTSALAYGGENILFLS